MTRKPSE
jgi:hypothetical protein